MRDDDSQHYFRPTIEKAGAPKDTRRSAAFSERYLLASNPRSGPLETAS